MTQTNNNISIKVGSVTLNSNDIPKDGIDLNKASKNSKEILSCFDVNNDGKLSRQEIKNAISVFSSKDENIKTDLGTVAKDGVLDDKELSNVKIYDTQQKRAKNVAELKNAAEVLVKNMVREKMDLQPTYNDNWAKDSSGTHYKWNGATYQKQDNVYFVAKNGSYKTKDKTDDKNAFIHTTYMPNGLPKSIQLKTADNKKAYANPNFVDKKVGNHIPRGISTTIEENGDIHSHIQTPEEAGWRWDKNGNKFVRTYSADEQEMLCKTMGIKPEDFR